jgi:hypothetical protein
MMTKERLCCDEDLIFKSIYKNTVFFKMGWMVAGSV